MSPPATSQPPVRPPAPPAVPGPPTRGTWRPTRLHALLLGAGAIACIAAALVGHYRFGDSLYLYRDVKGMTGAFQGSMTAVSGFLLVAAAVLMARAAELLHRRAAPAARSALVFALLLAFLAFDEVVMVHEWAAEKLDHLGIPKPFGIDQDIYVFAVYGVVAALCAIRLVPLALAHRRLLPLLVLMVAFAFASEGADFVPWDSLSLHEQTWLGPIEEGTKTMATLCAVLWTHGLLDEVERAAR